MTRRHREEAYVELENVFIKAESKSGLAFIVRFPEGDERAVPKSQIAPGCNPEVGETVDLRVTEWLAERIEEERADGPREQPSVEVADVVGLRETDKGLQVKVGDRPIWLPKWAVLPSSEVQHDGNFGKLVLLERVAVEKGIVAGPNGGRSAGEDVRQKALPLAPSEDPDEDLPF